MSDYSCHDESAFPVQLCDRDGNPAHPGCVGMSMWDYFAAQALSGAALSVRPVGPLVQAAADIADAMMAERARRIAPPAAPSAPKEQQP